MAHLFFSIQKADYFPAKLMSKYDIFFGRNGTFSYGDVGSANSCIIDLYKYIVKTCQFGDIPISFIDS